MHNLLQKKVQGQGQGIMLISYKKHKYFKHMIICQRQVPNEIYRQVTNIGYTFLVIDHKQKKIEERNKQNKPNQNKRQTKDRNETIKKQEIEWNIETAN